jgi:feruloyl-CoA synthase
VLQGRRIRQARFGPSDVVAERRISYARTLDCVRRLGQALLDADLAPERPLVILSGNDIEHALLGLAALYVGIPYAPISPAART